MNTKLIALISGGALLCASLTGCVAKKDYQALQSKHEQLTKDYNDLLENYHKSSSKAQTIEALLEQERRNNKELKDSYANLQTSLDKSLTNNAQGSVNIEKLVDQINASNKYIQQLVNAKSKSDSLNLTLVTNLTRSLTPSETDEVNVKVLKGVVYISLADNMLFKSGSYEVNERAMQTLGKIAKIIKDYSDYDVLVEGNTDDVRLMSRQDLKDNWDLSALRATSIVRILQDDFGVNPSRMTAGGRGEYNPIADNSTEIGRQRNTPAAPKSSSLPSSTSSSTSSTRHPRRTTDNIRT